MMKYYSVLVWNLDMNTDCDSLTSNKSYPNYSVLELFVKYSLVRSNIKTQKHLATLHKDFTEWLSCEKGQLLYFFVQGFELNSPGCVISSTNLWWKNFLFVQQSFLLKTRSFYQEVSGWIYLISSVSSIEICHGQLNWHQSDLLL